MVVGEVDKHTLAKPLLAWRDPAPMLVQRVELTFMGVGGRYDNLLLLNILEKPLSGLRGPFYDDKDLRISSDEHFTINDDASMMMINRWKAGCPLPSSLLPNDACR